MSEVIRLTDLDPDRIFKIESSIGTIEVTPKSIQALMAPEANYADCLRLILICQSAKLNPLLKEAYLVKFGNKHEVIVSINGWLKRANSQPDYRGHTEGILACMIDPKTKVQGEVRDFRGTFLPPNHILLGAWAEVYRQGFEKPFYTSVSCKEYAKRNPTWDQFGCTMITKVALVRAITGAFGLRDSYLEEEIPEPEKPLAQSFVSLVNNHVNNNDSRKIEDMKTRVQLASDELESIGVNYKDKDKDEIEGENEGENEGEKITLRAKIWLLKDQLNVEDERWRLTLVNRGVTSLDQLKLADLREIHQKMQNDWKKRDTALMDSVMESFAEMGDSPTVLSYDSGLKINPETRRKP